MTPWVDMSPLQDDVLGWRPCVHASDSLTYRTMAEMMTLPYLLCSGSTR